MAEAPAWTIEDYIRESGERPVRTFISGLSDPDRVDTAALIKVLAERGNRMRRPESGALGDGLFELRGHQVRIFYMFRPGWRIILLCGIVKKRGTIPPDALTLARKYQRDVQRREARDRGGR